MTAVYHDTDDLTLFRWGITLRRREGGADEGWHIKFPVDGADSSSRDELQLPLAEGAIGEVPAAYRDLVSALVRGHLLGPVVTLRTERHPYHLLDSQGRLVAELVDDTVSILDGGRVASSFREIEVEECDIEVRAADDLLDAVVAALMAEGATPGSSSKAAGALGPRASAPPDIPEPEWPRPGGVSGDAVRALLATHTRRLLLQDVRFRRDLPDSVHQMRVAIRRLRSGLKVFRDLVDEDWASGLRTELGWAASQLGLSRDTEVLAERLQRHADQLEPTDAVRAWKAMAPWLAQRADQARLVALESLSTDRYGAMLQSLMTASVSPVLTEQADLPCATTMPPLVNSAFRRLRSAIAELTDESPSTDWHEARIDAKRARYAIEAIVPIFGDKARPIVARFAEVTDVLGEHQDAYVAQEAIRERMALGEVDAPTAFSLGLLHGVEVRDELQLRIDFWRIWPVVCADYRKHRIG
jgi:CHAD domain-containing protein